MNSTQEVHVLLPDCLTFRSGQLVWSRDVVKGSLLLLQDGDIQRISVDVGKLNDIQEVFVVFLNVFCVPYLATYIFSKIEPRLGEEIDPGMALAPFPSMVIWMRRDSNSKSFDL